MVVRHKHAQHSASPRPPLPRQAKLALCGSVVVVVAAAALIAVHVATAARAPVPLAASSYAGSLELDASGAELASWNQTSTFCPEASWQVPDGSVATDSSGDATLSTTGKPGSCVSIISPGAYSSAVIEADIDFPALPGKPGTIADWTAFWLTNQAAWPTDGELDAVEAEPATGVNAVSWHWGTSQSPLDKSTDGFASNGTLPVDGPNLTPGWHVVDIVYTKGFFAVYYDSKLFSTFRGGIVKGAALNILLNSSVTPDTSAVRKSIGGNAPQNSDSSPATVAVKYLKVWSYK